MTDVKATPPLCLTAAMLRSRRKIVDHFSSSLERLCHSSNLRLPLAELGIIRRLSSSVRW